MSDNIRIYTSTDQLSHVTTNTYDSYGRLYTQKDYLSNIATYVYDDLGRTSGVSLSDGSQTTTFFGWENPTSDPVSARYSVQKTGNDGSQTKSWLDDLGREIRSGVKGFDGTMIYTSTVYNIKGQVESVSDPYYSNGTALLNTFLYDPYGRKTSLTRPSGRNTTWVYNSNTATETTAGKSFSKTYSSDGTISAATDAGGTISYTYYNDGKVKTITAPGGIVTSLQYDPAGNQNQLVDPSAGTISYTYNGFGELTDQQNAKAQTTHLTYYDDGRPNQKILSVEGTTTYSYNSNKQLTGISSPGSISRSIGYDTKGRITTLTETIPGSSPFTTTLVYDNTYGRLMTITHPSGIIETKNYNSSGYVCSVSTGGIVRWTTTGMSARQQVTAGQYWKSGGNLSATFGYNTNDGSPTSTVAGTIQNYSYNFDPVSGNLKWRTNIKYSGLTDSLQYDNLDRLSTVSMGGKVTLNMGYDGNKGGINAKSDVGTLIYNDPLHTYAVSSVNQTNSLIKTSHSITYTSFECVSTISENNYSASFIYNSDNQRAQMIVKQNSSTILTRWYLTDNYIKENAGGVTKEYTFIGGDSYSAPIVAITQSGTTTYYDILRDYLGNITHVVNATTGAVTAEYSYDAWGRMRNPSTWVNYAPGSEPVLFIAGRGFTGHEHLPWFNLINMNGRVYDPLLGMFLSADNYVQNPGLTQNFNRYGYCLNNPLRYSDPSGYTWLSHFGNWIGGTTVGKIIASVAINVTGIACLVATGGTFGWVGYYNGKSDWNINAGGWSSGYADACHGSGLPYFLNIGGNKEGLHVFGYTVIPFNSPDKPSSSYTSDSGTGITESDLDNLGDNSKENYNSVEYTGFYYDNAEEMRNQLHHMSDMQGGVELILAEDYKGGAYLFPSKVYDGSEWLNNGPNNAWWSNYHLDVLNLNLSNIRRFGHDHDKNYYFTDPEDYNLYNTWEKSIYIIMPDGTIHYKHYPTGVEYDYLPDY